MSDRTIDCTRYDYAFTPRDEGQRGTITCWTVPPGGKPKPGDYLLLKNGQRSSRYQVESTNPCWGVDPATMWISRVSFAPRTHTGANEA